MKIRRWGFAVLWVLSLAAVSFFGGAVSYGLFFAMTLLPAVSLLYIACVLARFKIYQELGNRSMVCGQPEPYFFVLQNEDHFAFASVSVSFFSDFSRIEGLPENAEHVLLPGDRFAYETKLTCKYRGEYEVGIKETTVTDFFRLFRIKCAASGRIKALVLPQTIRLTALRAIQDIPALPQRENTAGMEPDSMVRDYTEGDSLNRIHWKATAREGKLKVRVRRGGGKKRNFRFVRDKTVRKKAGRIPAPGKQDTGSAAGAGLFLCGKKYGRIHTVWAKGTDAAADSGNRGL